MENITNKLIYLYLSGRFAPASEEKLQKWLLEDTHIEEKENASLQYWKALKVTPGRQTYAALERVKHRVGLPLNSFVPPTTFTRRWRAVAAIILFFLLAGTSYLWYISTSTDYTEISVACGDSKYLILPDGSIVWVNAGTTIRYPEDFAVSRSIHLNGEACFSVKKDEQHPFVVHTGHLTVSVLGTVFNVRAYDDDTETVATLESGQIKIDTEAGESRVLVPGEQLNFNNKTAEIRLKEVNPEEAAAWKDGALIFTDVTLTEILRVLCRQFNLKMPGSLPQSDIRYTIRFTTQDKPEHILNVMSEITGYSLRLEGNTITIARR